MDSNQLAALIRQAVAPFKARLEALEGTVKPMGPEDIINCIPGRRTLFNFMGYQDFTASNDGTRGTPINFLVSMDGPFIMTHYPMIMWKSTLPTNATDFGRWRPVSTWPVPDQVLDTNIVDISYEIQDTGPSRNFQNDTAPAGMLSMPGALLKLPVPTKFEPNSTISLTVFYENILFEGSTPTTGGKLAVCLPGYKILTSVGNG